MIQNKKLINNPGMAKKGDIFIPNLLTRGTKKRGVNAHPTFPMAINMACENDFLLPLCLATIVDA